MFSPSPVGMLLGSRKVVFMKNSEKMRLDRSEVGEFERGEGERGRDDEI